MKIKKRVILFAVSFMLFGLLSLRYFNLKAVSQMPQEQSGTSRTKSKIVVKVAPVQKDDFTLTFDYVGTLKAKDEAGVFSKVTGKLFEYTVNEGDAVQKGQTIASIDRDETGLKFELAKVESPITGIVGRVLLDKGANISPNTSILAIVLDMDEMRVGLNIPEQNIPYVKKDLKAIIKVDAYSDVEFAGNVERVAEMVDSQTRT